MESQALEIRSGNHIEQLKELNVKLQEVLEHLPEDAEEKVWAEELEKIGNRIQRLGAINLAAIEEYQVQKRAKDLPGRAAQRPDGSAGNPGQCYPEN